MAAGGHFALQVAAKPLRIATLLLLAAYRNLPTPYPTASSPTLYDLSFSHNTKRYDRRQTDGRHIVPLARPVVRSAKNQKDNMTGQKAHPVGLQCLTVCVCVCGILRAGGRVRQSVGAASERWVGVQSPAGRVKTPRLHHHHVLTRATDRRTNGQARRVMRPGGLTNDHHVRQCAFADRRRTTHIDVINV